MFDLGPFCAPFFYCRMFSINSSFPISFSYSTEGVTSERKARSFSSRVVDYWNIEYIRARRYFYIKNIRIFPKNCLMRNFFEKLLRENTAGLIPQKYSPTFFINWICLCTLLKVHSCVKVHIDYRINTCWLGKLTVQNEENLKYSLILNIKIWSSINENFICELSSLNFAFVMT